MLNKKHLAILALILLISLAIRAYRATDPIGGYNASEEGIYSLPLPAGGTQASPLYSSLIYLAHLSAGETEAAARSVSILSGMIVILAVFLIGSKVYNKKTGLTAAAFCAVAPVMVITGRNIQPDTLCISLLLFAIYYFIIAENSQKYRDFIITGVFFGLSLLTGFLPLCLLPALAAYKLCKDKGFSRENLKNHAIAATAAVLTSLPIHLVIFIINRTSPLIHEAQTALDTTVWEAIHMAISEMNWGYSPLIFIPFLVSLLFTLPSALKKKEENLLVVFTFFSFLLAFMLNYQHSGYLLFTFPFAALILAAWLSSPKSILLTPVLTLLISTGAILLSLLHLAGLKYGLDGFSQFARIADASESRSPVVVFNNDIEKNHKSILAYYCRRCEFYNYEKNATDSEKLQLDYSQDIYYLGFFADNTTPNPQIKFLFEKAYGIIFEDKVLMLEIKNSNLFTVKNIIFNNIRDINKNYRARSRMPSIDILWEYPYLVYYKLPKGFNFILHEGKVTLALS